LHAAIGAGLMACLFKALREAREMLGAFGMNSILKLLRLGRFCEEPPPQCQKALEALSASSLREARRRADRVLQNAKGCERCNSLLHHAFDCLGSTLFMDDDPHALKDAFPPTEWDRFSEQVLAALIVLNGRPRTLPRFAHASPNG
jgi:hypothetical protein